MDEIKKLSLQRDNRQLADKEKNVKGHYLWA